LAVQLEDQTIADGETIRSVLSQDLEHHLCWLARSALLMA
jgi:hypothetical protein